MENKAADWATKGQFVSNSVCQDVPFATFSAPNNAVTVLILCSRPQNAPALVCARCVPIEPLREFGCSQAVLRAKPPGVARTLFLKHSLACLANGHC
jgi:hypothetical protein